MLAPNLRYWQNTTYCKHETETKPCATRAGSASLRLGSLPLYRARNGRTAI